MGTTKYEGGDERVICRLPPPKDQRGLKAFLWNPEAKTVLGRTGKSWAQIGVFYVIFYFCLALYFSMLMFIFLRTLEPDTPKYTGADSLLTNPGLSFVPRTYHDELRPTIIYDPSNDQSSSPYVNSINKLWKAYDPRPSNAVDCQNDGVFRKADDPPCLFDLAATNTSCSPDDRWGYNTNSPCILLKLNRMFHWRPQPPESFEGLPEGLRSYIFNKSSEDPETALSQNAWVWCESEDVKIEQLSPGLPLSFFPYHMQEGYLSPLAPVRLLDLKAGQKVKVDCRVWAKNVEPKVGIRRTGQASVWVELTGEAPSK